MTSAVGQKGVYKVHLCYKLFGDIPCPNDNNISDHGHSHKFNHPFFQVFVMFLGEMLCFVAYKLIAVWHFRKGTTPITGKPFNPVVFLFPACCDMIGSFVMIVSLTMTYASVFQMLRGAVVVFTGLLSVVFLKKRLFKRHWVGMTLVIIGLVLVGAASKIEGDDKGQDTMSQLTGNLLVVIAQVIVAVQMIYEEMVIKKYDVPSLKAVGWEGIWGSSLLGLLLIPFYFIPLTISDVQPKRLENSIDALYQIHNSVPLIISNVTLLLSIAIFNFSGISVTKTMSATTRIVLDCLRTLFIWVISLALKWDKFYYLQLVGYLLLVCGTTIYYNLVFVPLWKKLKQKRMQEEKRLLCDTTNREVEN